MISLCWYSVLLVHLGWLGTLLTTTVGSVGAGVLCGGSLGLRLRGYLVVLQLNLLQLFDHVQIVGSLILSEHRLQAGLLQPLDEEEEAFGHRSDLIFLDSTRARPQRVLPRLSPPVGNHVCGVDSNRAQSRWTLF